MAKIVEEGVTLMFKRLAKNDQKLKPIITKEVMEAIESAMEELYGGPGIVVEVNGAEVAGE